MAAVMMTGCGADRPAPTTPTHPTPSGAEQAVTVERPITREPSPAPIMGVCGRSYAARAAIALALPDVPCRMVTEEQLAGIQAITIEGSLPGPGDLEGMTGLGKLEFREITEPTTRETLSEASQVRVLNIHIGRPEATGGDIRPALLEENALRDLGRLEELTVSGEDGWTEQALTAATLEGLENLRKIRMDYLEDVDEAAFRGTPRIREISLHGTRREDETHPRIHRATFAGLGQLRSVEVRNFRWPPVLDVKNEAVACSATGWASFKNDAQKGRRPLSVLIEGPHNRPRDVESMLGCREAP